MTPTELLEKLRALDAQIIPGPSPFREMAKTVEAMIDALAPFAAAAEKADQFCIEHVALGFGPLSDDASPGWGIRRKHVNFAREILGQNSGGVSRPDER